MGMIEKCFSGSCCLTVEHCRRVVSRLWKRLRIRLGVQPQWVVRNVHGDKFNKIDKFTMYFVNVLLCSNQNK